MVIKKYNYNIINWSKFITEYKIIAQNNNKKIIINNNIYILLLLLFKYFILKDMCLVNYKNILKIFNSNIFNDISEFRLYFLFYYIIIENNLIKFLWYIHIQLIEKQIDYTIKNSCSYYHNNFIIFFIYLLSNKENYLLNYSKYNFYKNKTLLKKIFIYREFIIKVDYTTIHIYMKYIEYFRKTKYNEYITNNKLLWNYPKLKDILIIKINKGILFEKYNYRAAILLKFFNIYHIISNSDLNIDKNIRFINKFKHNQILKNNIKKNSSLINNSAIDNYNESNKSKILYKSFSLFKFKNLAIDNEHLITKITNLNIFKFLDLINPFSYFKFLKIFKNILTIYIIFITHEIYNRYILLSKKLRKIKFRHLISIHYKYQSIQFKFISYIYKYYFMNYNNKIFSKPSLINYGFLSYYYLENNIYIINYIKKNILLYRILNIFIVKHINIKFHNFFNYIDVEAHKANSFKNPALQKMWNINYIKNWKYKYPLHAPLYSNVFEGYNYDNRINHIISYNKNMPIPKNYYITQINWNFLSYWKTIIKWSFIKFYTILNNVSNELELSKIIYNYKYSLELIFWEIINSNNSKYNKYKYFLNFNILSKNIKITNIINVYFNKYFNAIINYFIKYSKDHLINISFCYYLFHDFFINIYTNINVTNHEIEKLIKKNIYIMDKYKKNYNNFFLWQIKNYCSLLRFKNFYFKNEYKYYMEYYIPISYPWETNYKIWLEKLHEKWKTKLQNEKNKI